MQLKYLGEFKNLELSVMVEEILKVRIKNH